MRGSDQSNPIRWVLYEDFSLRLRKESCIEVLAANPLVLLSLVVKEFISVGPHALCLLKLLLNEE